MIKASDTYVLAIAVSVLPILQDLGVEKLWIKQRELLFENTKTKK
jgi:hypothetical protein